MEYYSGIKKNEILPFATTWTDMEGIMLSEISQTETYTVWFHLYVESNKIKQIHKCNKAETELQIQRTNRWLPEGRSRRRKEIGERD